MAPSNTLQHGMPLCSLAETQYVLPIRSMSVLSAMVAAMATFVAALSQVMFRDASSRAQMAIALTDVVKNAKAFLPMNCFSRPPIAFVTFLKSVNRLQSVLQNDAVVSAMISVPFGLSIVVLQ